MHRFFFRPAVDKTNPFVHNTERREKKYGCWIQDMRVKRIAQLPPVLLIKKVMTRTMQTDDTLSCVATKKKKKESVLSRLGFLPSDNDYSTLSLSLREWNRLLSQCRMRYRDSVTFRPQVKIEKNVFHRDFVFQARRCRDRRPPSLRLHHLRPLQEHHGDVGNSSSCCNDSFFERRQLEVLSAAAGETAVHVFREGHSQGLQGRRRLQRSQVWRRHGY